VLRPYQFSPMRNYNVTEGRSNQLWSRGRLWSQSQHWSQKFTSHLGLVTCSMVVLTIWSALSWLLTSRLQIFRVLGGKPHHHVNVADHAGEELSTYFIHYFVLRVVADDLQSLLFDESLTTYSHEVDEVGKFSFSVCSSDDECIEVKSSSIAVIDDVPCGTVMSVRLSRAGQLLEQNQFEYLKVCTKSTVAATITTATATTHAGSSSCYSTPCPKKRAKLFSSQLLQISTDFDNFLAQRWPRR